MIDTMVDIWSPGVSASFETLLNFRVFGLSVELSQLRFGLLATDKRYLAPFMLDAMHRASCFQIKSWFRLLSYG